MTICDYMKNVCRGVKTAATLVLAVPLLHSAVSCADVSQGSQPTQPDSQRSIPSGSQHPIPGSDYRVVENGCRLNLTLNNRLAAAKARMLADEFGPSVDEICGRYDNGDGFITDDEFRKILHEELGATSYTIENGRLTPTRR
jgi:hypothetical protein